MNLEAAARILARAAAYDRRTIGAADVRAWHDALADLDEAACHLAVIAHYRDQTDWLMPAHIRRHVEAEARVEAERRHSAELRRMLDSAEASIGEDRPQAVKDLLAEVRRRLPAVPSAVAFRRPEWRDADRARRPDRVGDADLPNPHFAGPPPAGGFPIPDVAEEQP